MQRPYHKIFDNYEIQIVKLTDYDFELRWIFRDNLKSVCLLDTKEYEEAFNMANKFLDVYDIAREYNFSVYGDGMRHTNGTHFTFDQMFQIDLAYLKHLMETEFKAS